MKTICPQRSLLTVPKVVFVEKFYQMFLIDTYSFNPIQIPVDFSLKIRGKSQFTNWIGDFLLTKSGRKGFFDFLV